MVSSIEYKLRTDCGIFAFKLTKHINRDTQQIDSLGINLGSKNNKCVQLKIPSQESGGTIGYLMWVEAEENCSFEKYIESGLSHHMILLGIKLGKMFNRNLNRIELEDTSSFKCQLPNGIQQVPMKPFHIAFHQATWYEHYFGAKLQSRHDEYLAAKEHIFNAAYKPDRFDFINDSLQDELEPLYISSNTWYDFFKAISEKYGRKKCGVIYPWIVHAMSDIFESSIYQDTKWYIDLENNPKIKNVDVTLQERIGGGKRKTQKKRRARRFTFSRTDLFPHIRKIQGWNYRGFLEN